MKNATYAERAKKSDPVSQRQVDQPSWRAGRSEGWSGSGPVSQGQADQWAGQATGERAPTAGTASRHVLANLPAEPGARALRQSAVLQMQQECGNAYVAQVVQSQPNEGSVQRAIEIDEVESTVEGGSPGPEATAGGATPTEMTADGSTVRVTPGAVEISGGTVNVDSAMTRFSGAVQSDTLMANSVIASTYSPGAGNIW